MFANKKKVKTGISLMAAIMFFGVVSGASFVAEAQDVRFKKKTVINFEDDTIEGDLKTPDGAYVDIRNRMRHRSLIRIRKEFRREVLGSIADL